MAARTNRVHPDAGHVKMGALAMVDPGRRAR